MRTIKYLCQIVASVVYSGLFVSLFYSITVLPLIWVLTLSWWQILLALFLLGGVAKFVITAFQVFMGVPYTWICKNNAMATGYGILVIVGSLVAFLCGLWHRGCSNFCGFLALSFLSVLLVVSTYRYTRMLIFFYSKQSTKKGEAC